MSLLLRKIKKKKSTICIVGLGYVGLPLAISFSKLGFKVIGYDTDDNKIQKLINNKIYVDTIKIKEFVSIKKKIFFTSNEKKISNSDIFIICVPTPITKNKSPDVSFLEESKHLVSKFKLKNKCIILESTTYPGTTEEFFLPVSKKQKLQTGKNFYLAYSPERIDPGNQEFKVDNTPKVVSGYTTNCLKIVNTLYSFITKTYAVKNLKTAEFTKLIENVYRSVNIGFVNEMKLIADKLDIDIFESILAASTKPFGFVPFFPGPGLGGHCIPVDPFLLSWKAKELDYNARFIELSGQINDYMPIYIVQKLTELLNQNDKNIKNCKILLIGVAYKKNSNDIRESPAIKIIQKLHEQKAKIFFEDNFVELKKVDNAFKININYKKLNKYDAVMIISDHDYIDYKKLEKNSKLIVDCRGRLKKITKTKIRA